MNQVITISREYGSGGRELGVRLAKALGIPFYDKEVISMAADDMEIAEEAFRRYDEQIEIPDYLNRERSRVLSSLYEVPISDQLFVAQSNVICRLASRGPAWWSALRGSDSGEQHQSFCPCRDGTEGRAYHGCGGQL